MGLIDVVSSVAGLYSQNSSLEAQGRAQQETARSMVQSMNYSFANMEQERRSAFEASIDELTNTRLQALRQKSSVDAAVNEGIVGGGRTAALIKRSVANDTARTIGSIKTNYAKKSNEIDLNKEAALLNTKRQIDSMPKIEKPSFLSSALGLAGDYYGYKNMQDEKKHRRNMAGINSKSGSNKRYGAGEH